LIAVFIPSTPAAFSGYVLVVPREQVVELPMTVEQAMRLLVTGGVLMEPGKGFKPGAKNFGLSVEGAGTNAAEPSAALSGMNGGESSAAAGGTGAGAVESEAIAS
jgi:hypothetical protein